MKLKKFATLLRGLAAVMAVLLTLSAVAYTIAMSSTARGMVDEFFGFDRTIYDDWTETVDGYVIPGTFGGYSYLKGVRYSPKHADETAFAKALMEHAVKQGEEGFALLKNDNGALPLNKSTAGANIALFGYNAYNMPKAHTGVVAGNGNNNAYPQITLDKAFANIDGITINTTVTKNDFSGAMTGPSTKSGGGFTAPSKPWSEVDYTRPEGAPKNTDNWDIDTNTTTGIVVIGRGGGEGNNYKVDGADNGTDDPLALSPNEKQLVKEAKDRCAKVVVLIVSANAMELGPLVEKDGEYEVDAIGFCGIPNDYQYQGIANVLAGKANATGGLTDTYVYDNSFTPASINMGEQQYEDLDTITSFTDPLGRSAASTTLNNYYAANYIVEAEGIYVGYKYYETRYFDSIVDGAGTKATSTKGSTDVGQAWNYANEVVFPFGQSLSYIPYTQEVTKVEVDLSEHGKIVATVKVTNKGTEDGYFLAQLYVNRPYTSNDVAHKVEKSAIDFLNSAKVKVQAGKSEEVKIVLPTRYLASWDSMARNGKGSYILDAGDYIFTAAPGAHAAVNNVLASLNHDTDGTTTIGATQTWNLKELDETTYSMSNGVEVKNQMQNADVNYFYGEEVVTYLSRSDWEGTFPKNYTNYTNKSGIEPEAKFNISQAKNKNEWLIELISAQYKVTPVTDESKWVNVNPVLPKEVTGTRDEVEGTFETVWQWIMNLALTDPEAFSDIHSDAWQAVAQAIPLGIAISSVPLGGGSTHPWEGVNNPGSKQSESVAGYSQTLNWTDESGAKKSMKLAIASNTLLGASFNPDLAYEWGLLEGECGLWLQKNGGEANYGKNAMTVWGAGYTLHRHAYCGRNSEYMSEDPMLVNRIGESQLRGATEMGAICGPKHMGFNDQEYHREGNACYMTEQKVRETDTRAFEGALRVDEGNGTGVMMSFTRIGATNVTNSVGYIKNIMRGEWGFTGIVTSDMGKGAGYHEYGAMIMATVNEYAGFNSLSPTMGDGVSDDAIVADKDNQWAYITLGNARKDPVFANQARQTALYLLFTIARSGSGLYVQRMENIGDDIVVDGYTIDHHDPVGQVDKAPWENIFIALEAVFGTLTGLAGCAWIASIVLPEKKEEK